MDISNVFSQVHESIKIKDLYKSIDLKDKNRKKEIEEVLGLKEPLKTYEELTDVAYFLNVNIDNIYVACRLFDMYYYIDENGVFVSLYNGEIEVLKTFRVKELIAFQVNKYKKLLEEKDYDVYFSILESKIKIEMLNKLFDKIPKSKRYNIFIKVYSSVEYGFNNINKEIIENIKEVMPEETQRTLSSMADRNREITIYRGATEKSTSLHKAMSWTTNINTATSFAVRFGNSSPYIYSAKVSIDDIVAFIDNRGEDEVLVNFRDIKKLKNLNSLNFEELVYSYPETMEYYNSYKHHVDSNLFFEPEGIHGVSHAKRVLFLVLALSLLENLHSNERDILIESAVYHDIGRHNDDVCVEHGIKSYKIIKEMGLLEEDETIRYIIENHCIKDENFIPINKYKIKNKTKAKKLLSIFKDADALDRVRVKALDVNYLRNESAKHLLTVAHQLLQIKM